MGRLSLAAICLCALSAAAVSSAQKTARAWVDDARTAEQFQTKHVVSLDDACVRTVKSGDASITAADGVAVDSINVTAGVGTIIDICASGTEMTHIFKAAELFLGSALWKVTSTNGYVVGEQLIECKAHAGGCCSIYFVPLAAADETYIAELESCQAATIKVNVAGNPDAPRLDLLPYGNGAEEGAVEDGDAAIDVEVTLVFDPACNLGPPSEEGADDVLEGGEEGEGSVPAPPESADGEVEGGEEGSVPAENEDGIVEGTGEEGEGMAPPTRRLLQGVLEEGDTPPVDTAVWYWSKGHSINQNTLIDPNAPEPIEGGEGEGEGSVEGSRRLLGFRANGGGRRLLENVLMYDASETPIQLVVGRDYKLMISMVRSPSAAYFYAPELLAASFVRNVEDANILVEMERFHAVEMYQDVGYFHVYVRPSVVGTFTFGMTDDPENLGSTGTIEVVATIDDVSDSTAFVEHDVAPGACGTEDGTPSPPGALPPPGAPVGAAAAAQWTAVLATAMAAVFAVL